jgi:hypothetical protein
VYRQGFVSRVINCNRHFRSQTCFDNHKQTLSNKKYVCERKRICESCGGLIKRDGHECNRRYCATCGQQRETGHLCFIKLLQNEPVSKENVLFVFYDFDTTQDTKYSEKATVHVPNLVCVQQFCSQCESTEDVEKDCSRCGRRIHSFWQDPVGDFLSYLCEQRKLPDAFGLTSSKSWYPHYFNTNENLKYIGRIPHVSFYGLCEMGETERREFLAWYEGQKN